MKVLFATSVLVAALIDSHTNHASAASTKLVHIIGILKSCDFTSQQIST